MPQAYPKDIKKNMPTITLLYENEDNEEITAELPAKMRVCSDCDGIGWVLNESMRHYAYSPEEFMNDFDDEERAQYQTRGGIYDVRCPTCQGKNVEPIVDESQLTDEQKVFFSEWKKFDEKIAKSNREYEAMVRMERLMGA
jgi:hypothetical protein